MVSSAEMERMMKVQEVILKAMAGKLKWWEAAEIIGVSDRTMRRWRERYEGHAWDGLYDGRKRRPSPRRVPLKTVERVLQLYREKYVDSNVRHFHDKLAGEHDLKTQLHLGEDGAARRRPGEQTAATHGASTRARRRPLPGMPRHIDASKHAWFGDGRLLRSDPLLDDATSEIY